MQDGKFGIFLSRCGGELVDSVDLEELALHYSTRAASVGVYDSFFEPKQFGELMFEVEANELDALLLVGNSPYYYQQIRNGDYLFRCLSERGVNPNRIEIVNLKNMIAVPHKDERSELLMEKARLLIDAAIEKVTLCHEIDTVEVAPRKAVAVVGVNTASFVAAHHLLEEGYKVYLINRRADLDLPPREAQYIHPTMSSVTRHPRLTVYNESEIEDFLGYPGDYHLRIQSAHKVVSLPVGAVVLSLQGEPAMVKAAHTIFHVDVTDDGTLAVRDEVTARSQTLDRGIFVVAPRRAEDSDLGIDFQAADAAASMVINLLNRSEIYHPVRVSEVHVDLCSGCGACVKTCMFEAVKLAGDPPLSHIDPRRCRGCGNCVTACPANARDLVSNPNQALFKAVDIFAGFAKGQPIRRVLFLACEGCGYRCLDNAAEGGHTWPIGLMPLRAACGGQMDMQLVMYAFAKGFDGVILAICGEGCCHHIIGNVDLERRANLLRELLECRGIGPERLRIFSTCSRKGQECADDISRFYAAIDGREVAGGTIVLPVGGK